MVCYFNRKGEYIMYYGAQIIHFWGSLSDWFLNGFVTPELFIRTLGF